MSLWRWALFIFSAALFVITIFQRDVNANSDNWETLESRLLARASEFAWRKGNTLYLQLLDKSTIQLTDVPSDLKNNNYYMHRLIGYIELHEYFVIGISHHTGLSGLLIDRKTGQRTELDAIAIFSPDNTRFFTIDFTRYLNSKNRIQVWKVTPSGPVLEWEFQPKLRVWSDVKAKWSSNTSIYIIRQEHWTYSNNGNVRTRRIQRESNLVPMLRGWQFIDLPRPPEPPSM